MIARKSIPNPWMRMIARSGNYRFSASEIKKKDFFLTHSAQSALSVDQVEIALISVVCNPSHIGCYVDYDEDQRRPCIRPEAFRNLLSLVIGVGGTWNAVTGRAHADGDRGHGSERQRGVSCICCWRAARSQVVGPLGRGSPASGDVAAFCFVG